jgi:hypothetical protein
MNVRWLAAEARDLERAREFSRRAARPLTLLLHGVLCLVSLFAAPAAAQPRDYVVDVWDTDRGLPSSLVTSLAQTPEGYLWVATQNGLLRFDGLAGGTAATASGLQLGHGRRSQDGRARAASASRSIGTKAEREWGAERRTSPSSSIPP